MYTLFQSHKKTFFGILFLVLFGATVASATIPTSQTLNPDCLPTDPTCVVSIAGSSVWGSITGTLANQTDLQNALDAKQVTITTGTSAQYLRGDLSLAPFPTIPTVPTVLGAFTNDVGYITGNQTITLSGDLTGSGATSISATLRTVNSNVGSFGSSTSIPTFTVNAKGLITAVSGNPVVAPAGTLSGTTLNSTVTNSSLTSVGTIVSGTWQGTSIADAYISSAATWNAKQNAITTGTTAQYLRGDLSLAPFPTIPTTLGALTNDVGYVLGTRTISAGTGIAGGGDLSANRTLSLDINSLTAKNTALMADTIPVYDSATSSIKKISRSDFLQGVTGAIIYQGAYNAATNTPAITDASGSAGQEYVVTVAGVRNFGSGSITMGIGDFLIHNGSIWQLAPSSSSVSGVFGRTGSITAQVGDYTTTEVTEGSRLYFTNARAIASTLTGYTSGAGTITSADSVLSAIQKLNGNIGALVTGVSSVNSATGAVSLSVSNTGTGGTLQWSGTALQIPQAGTTTTGLLSTTDWNTFNNKQSTLTFGTGLTNTSGTITANISTGVSGGQTIYGGTGPGENLTLTSTSSVTKGKIFFGQSQLTAYDGVNDRFGIGTNAPLGRLDVVGSSSSTDLVAFDSNRSISVINTNTSVNNAQGIALRSYGTDGTTIQSGVKLLAVNTARTATTLTSDLAILTNNAGTISEKARLTSTGRLGLGTTSPNTQIDATSWIGSRTGVWVGADIWSGGVPTNGLRISGIGTFDVGSGSGFQYTFRTNSQNRLTITDTQMTSSVATSITDTVNAASGSLAGSVVNLAQTWNTTGTPTAIKLNVTNTASNSSSLLLDLQAGTTGGTSMFKVDGFGATTLGSTGAIAGLTVKSNSGTTLVVGNSQIQLPTTVLPISSGTVSFLAKAVTGIGWTFGYNNNPDQTTGATMINIGGTYSTQSNAVSNNISITPIYNVNANTTSSSILRGIYYNPTLTSIGSAKHIAWENTTGDALFGTTSGSVGIGTSTPGAKLHIVSTSEQLRLANTSSIYFSYTVNASTTLTITPTQGNTTGINYTKADGTTSILDIDTQNARVGIGTTSPGYSLDVQGTSRFGGTTDFASINSAGILTFGGAGMYRVGDNRYAFQSATYTNAGIYFNASGLSLDLMNTSGVAAAKIGINGSNTYFGVDSGGNSFVGIGNSNPIYRLDVLGPTSTPLRVSTASANSCTFSTGTGSWSCSSDLRLKHDIVSIDDIGAAKILSLRPVTFHYNWQQDSEPVIPGFIAQEFETVFPELVTTDPATGYKTLAYTPLIPYTIKAIQGLDIKINAILPAETDQSAYAKIKTFLQGIAEQSTAIIDTVQTHKLCVDDVCVTRDQFKQMLEQSQQQSAPSINTAPAPDIAPAAPDTPIAPAEIPQN